MAEKTPGLAKIVENASSAWFGRIWAQSGQNRGSGENVALHLRKAVIRKGLTSSALVLAIALGSAWFSRSLSLNLGSIALFTLLALALGALAAWFTLRSMAQGILHAIPGAMAYARVPRHPTLNGVAIDWQQIDDYAAQLKALGFIHVTDVTGYPVARSLTGVAAIYCDSLGSTLVEIQYIQPDVHFSIFSLLGGTIRVTVTDHTPSASNYVMRSSADVLAAYPGQNLMALLDKHRRLVQTLRERTGKQLTPGLTLARYVMLQRERFQWVRQRLSELGAYKLINEFDWFEANPATNWAPPSAHLASYPVRDFSELDKLQASQTQALVLDWASHEASSALTPNVGSATLPERPAEANLKQQVSRAASWFYWISALSVMNMVALLFGSKWNFALGLGLSQRLITEAQQLYASGAPGAAIFALYVGGIGIMLFFAACGWFARKPSVFVFMVGMVFYALDTLIFLIALDGVGVLIHVVALFFLRLGVPAARVLREG